MAEGGSGLMSNPVAQMVVAVVMVILGFFAIAGSDVSLGLAYWIWIVVVAVYAVADFAATTKAVDEKSDAVRGIPATLLHWLAVFLAIQLMYYFVAAGRIDNADTGLANGAILALGTFTAGIERNWRMMAVGIVLAFATIAVSAFEQYVWLMMFLVILASVVFVYGSRYFGHSDGGAGRP
ncbi:MAG: hypothetical protein AAGH83_02010 [Pseudomonadota bacterium]